MQRIRRTVASLVLLCGLLLAGTPPARASIPNGPEVVLIFVAVGLIGVGIGVGTYYAVHRPPTITGCVQSGAAGLALQDEHGGGSFLLTGDTANVHQGMRVRLRGKKKGKAPDRTFLTDRVAKEFGACPVTP